MDATFLANFICDWIAFGKVSNLSATMAASDVGLRAISSIVTCIMASTAQNYNNEKKNVSQFFVSVVDTFICVQRLIIAYDNLPIGDQTNFNLSA